jgi:hypothetical protein
MTNISSIYKSFSHCQGNTKNAAHCVSEEECLPSSGESAYHVSVAGVSHVQDPAEITDDFAKQF